MSFTKTKDLVKVLRIINLELLRTMFLLIQLFKYIQLKILT